MMLRGPLDLEAFAKLAHVDVDELRVYQVAGLLDPDADGLFDEYDILRLRLILHSRDLGRSLEEIADGLRDGAWGDIYAQLLYGGGDERFTVEDAASQSGVDADRIVALRTALGLPTTSLDARDLEVLRLVRAILETGVPWAAVHEGARVYGDVLRRLAETEVRIFRQHVEDPLDAAAVPEREKAERVQRVGELFSGTLDSLVQFVHRRHLMLAVLEDVIAELESSGGPQASGALEATIVFVDLASFTPLAQVHGDEVAAQVLERFDTQVRGLVLEHGGSLVKQIGDAFMLRFSEAVEALRFAIALDASTAVEPQFPAVRIGIHAGPVLHRFGDYVGNTVNLASRILALAGPNEIIVTRPVAAAANESDILVEPLGDVGIRGLVEPVALYRVVRTGRRATRRERDPVCGMIVGTDAVGRLVMGGFEFAFCSEECLRRFLEHPARFTSNEPNRADN